MSSWTRNHHRSNTHSLLILLLFRYFSILFLFLFDGRTRLWWPFIFIRINCPQNSASMAAHLAINKSGKDLKKYWSLTLIDWPCFYSSNGNHQMKRKRRELLFLFIWWFPPTTFSPLLSTLHSTPSVSSRTHPIKGQPLVWWASWSECAVASGGSQVDIILWGPLRK